MHWAVRLALWALAGVLLWWLAFKSEPFLLSKPFLLEWGPLVGKLGLFCWFLFAAFGGVSKHWAFRVALWVGSLIFCWWLAFESGPVLGRTAVLLGRWGLGIWLLVAVCRVWEGLQKIEAEGREEERERVEKEKAEEKARVERERAERAERERAEREERWAAERERARKTAPNLPSSGARSGSLVSGVVRSDRRVYVDKHRQERCYACDKVVFADWEGAQRAVLRFSSDEDLRRAYHEDRCGYWHLTSQAPRDVRL
ncbi:MAG: hypothetical protein OXM03_01900 [Chloroflexota bacterium]|nr:hypothetical protein [Chloroflexota bacterium]